MFRFQGTGRPDYFARFASRTINAQKLIIRYQNHGNHTFRALRQKLVDDSSTLISSTLIAAEIYYRRRTGVIQTMLTELPADLGIDICNIEYQYR